MIIPFLETLALAIAGGTLGRMGGSGNYSRQFRIIGVPACAIALMILLHGWHWTLIPCFGLTVGATSTYFKRSGDDVHWFNWLLVGLAFSLAMLPWEFHYQHWWGFFVRTVVLTNAMIVWNELIGKDVVEEFGRYFLIVATILIL